MIKYIALLRGVNISGKNKISMTKLKEEFKHLGYKEIITYLNSGNIIFNSNITDKDTIKNNIQLMIKSKFSLDIPIFIITSQELEELLNNNPNGWGKNDKETYDNIIFINMCASSGIFHAESARTRAESYSSGGGGFSSGGGGGGSFGGGGGGGGFR